MMKENNILVDKKYYVAPTLTVHGDIDAITLGDDLGEDLDAAFTTSAMTSNSTGRKKPKKNQFS
jgi:hypothetical protein